MLNVLAFGSCRIFDPLKLLRNRNEIKFHLKDAYWYTHSSGEVFQRHSILSGQKSISSELEHLVFEERDSKARPYSLDNYRDKPIDGVDCMVVEISTMKYFQCGDTRLQMYLMMKEAARREIPWPLASGFMRTPVDQRRHRYVSDFAALTEAFGKFMEHRQTDALLREDLGAIKALWSRPWLLVGHLNVPLPDGRRIPERALLNNVLEKWSIENNVPFFDPTQFYDEYGFEEAFDDISHYKNAFIPKVADALAERLKRF